MSTAPQVDFSQIRGDWHFHMNFLANAVSQTLKRAVKLWDPLKASVKAPEVEALLKKQVEVWARLDKDRDAKGSINVASPVLQEFISLCGQTQAPCDALEVASGASGSSSIYDSPLEHFTEAMRQVRSFADDLEMMREQKP